MGSRPPSLLLILRRWLAYGVSVLLVLEPTIHTANAQGIRPDAQAPAHQRPSVEAARNGVPLVNITAPNGQRVSLNKFSDFNVGTNGAILNNSRDTGTSKLGGVVQGNSNLQGGPTARLIVNQVTSANRSRLEGATEIFGDSAAYVLSNPNGITCDGCGFINTPRATLTTGAPRLDAAGRLGSLSVETGDVLIGPTGLDVTGLDAFDIVSRTVSLQGPLQGTDIGITAGRNTFDHATRTATEKAADGAAVPVVGVDSTALGGIYGNRIILRSTEDGVGVRMAGDMAARSGDLRISSDGALRLSSAASATSASLEAKGDVAVETTLGAVGAIDVRANSVSVDGTVTSGTDLTVVASALRNAGQMGAAGDVSLSIRGAATNSGTLAAGDTLTTHSGSFENTGDVTAVNSLTLTGGSVDNGGRIASPSVAITATDGVTNSGDIEASEAATLTSGTLSSTGTLAAGGPLTIDSDAAFNGGRLHAGRDLVLTATRLENSGDLLSAGAMTVTTGEVVNTGAIATDGTFALTAGNTASSGSIQSIGAATFSVGDLSNTGTILSGGALVVDGGAVFNGNSLAAGGTVTITATSLRNDGDLLSTGAMTVTSGTSTNSGTIGTDGAAVLKTGTLDTDGTILAAGALTLEGGAVRIGSGGRVAGGDAVSISADALDNAGTLTASQSLGLTVAGALHNAGEIAANGAMTAQASSINNAGALQTAAGLTLNGGSGDLTNSGTIAAGTDANVTAGRTINTGRMEASGDLGVTVSDMSGTGTLVGGTSLILAGSGGFHLDGTTASLGDMTIRAGGDVSTAAAARLVAGGNLSIGGRDIGLAGRTEAAGALAIDAVGALVAAAGSTTLADAGLVMNAGTSFTLNGTLSARQLALAATGDGTIGGTVIADQTAAINTGGALTLGSGGAVTTGSDATLTAAGAFRADGTLAVDGDATVDAAGATITSTGRLLARDILTLDTRGRVDNAGTLQSGLDLTVSAADTLENSGVIASGADLALSVTNGLRNLAGGALRAVETLAIGAGSLDNAAVMEGGDVATTIGGAVTNRSGAQITARDDMALTAGTSILNQGTLEAGGLLELTAGGTTSNIAAAVMRARDADLLFAVLNNAGTIATSRDLWLSGTTVDNSAMITVGGLADISGLSSLTNRDLLFAADGLSVGADALTNDGGAILSAGNMSFTGAGDGAATSFLNDAGVIESSDGDISIRADSVRNQGTATAASMERVLVSDKYIPMISMPMPSGCNMGDGCKGEYWRGIAAVPDERPGYTGTSYYGTSSSGSITSRVYETRPTALTGPTATLSAGGDLSIFADSIINDRSTISSGGDMTLIGGDLQNIGAAGTAEWYIIGSNHTWTRCFGTSLCTGFPNGGGSTRIATWTTPGAGAVIEAGGRLYGSFTGRIDNTTVREMTGGAAGSIDARIAQLSSSPVTLPTGEVDLLGLGVLYPGSAASAGSPVGPNGVAVTGGTAGIPLGKAPREPDGISVDAPSVSLGDLRAALGSRMAAFDSLFHTSPPSSRFVFETRFEYTDLGTFYGSDYFFQRLGGSGYDVEQLPKRLGDAYFDTRLARDAIIKATGRRWLDPDINDDRLQYKALLDGAVDVAGDLRLTPGVTLTQAQIDALDRDIVWYVATVVDGETVLMPRLYLSRASRERVRHSGATIAGDDVQLVAATVTNSEGRILSRGNLAVTARQSILNESGEIRAGGDISLTAQLGDIINTTRVHRSGDASGFDDMTIGRGTITAGGDLTLVAGRDIASIGADLTADGDAALLAGRDVTLAANALASHRDLTWDEGWLKQDVLRHDLARIAAGGDVAVVAGRDIGLMGATVDAGSDATLSAGRDLTVASVVDQRRFEMETSKKTSFGGRSQVHVQEYEATQVGSAVTAGGDVDLTAQRDLTLAASRATAGEDLSLTAETGRVALLAGENRSFRQETKSGRNHVWQRASDKGHDTTTHTTASLQAGDELTVEAVRGVTVDVAVPQGGDLQSTLNDLASRPETAWVVALKDRPDVDWRAVEAAHREWDHESQGLTGPAAAVVALAVAAATGGAGAALVGAAQGTIGAAVANAALTSLATQASISLINNQGNIGAVLKDLGSRDGIRALATAVVTAGLTHGVADVANLDMSVHAGLGDRIAMAGVKAGAGVITDTVINGDGLGEALRSGALSMATTVASQELFRSVGDIAETLDIDDGDLRKVVAHAVVGCAVGQITDNCVAGAIGAGLQELTGDTVDALAETPEGRVALSGLIAGATVLLAGGDANAVRAAGGIARDARSFNRQLHVEEVRRIRELAKDFAEQQGISEQEARQLLLAQAMRTVDRTYGDTHADWDQAAETFLRRHATDTIEIDGTDVLMFTPGGEDGAFYEAPELLVETWDLFEEEFQQAYLATPLSLRSEKMADQQAVLDAYLTVVSMMPYGGAFIAAAVEYEQAVRDGDHERADAIKQGVLIDLATSRLAVADKVLTLFNKSKRTPGGAVETAPDIVDNVVDGVPLHLGNPDSPYYVRIDAAHPRRPDPAYSVDTSTFASGRVTANGGIRNSRAFWTEWAAKPNAELSQSNRRLIASGRAPKVDDDWIDAFPEHEPFKGQTLVHHHMDYGRYAVPLPSQVHANAPGFGIWHPPN